MEVYIFVWHFVELKVKGYKSFVWIYVPIQLYYKDGINSFVLSCHVVRSEWVLLCSTELLYLDLIT